MPSPLYRPASRKGGTILLLLLVGIIGQIGVLILLGVLGWSKPLGAWVLLISCVPMLLPIVWGGMIYKRADRERVGNLQQRLIGHGFQLRSDNDKAAIETFCAPLLPLFPHIGRYGLRGSYDYAPTTSVAWHATQSGPYPALLFEHEYQLGTGKTAQQIAHTILAWPTGNAHVRGQEITQGKWSVISDFPKILAQVTTQGGDAQAAFMALYNNGCIAHEPATAQRFLTPGAIAELQKAPKRETWYLGAGWILCVYGATLDGENIDAFVHHAHAVVTAT